MIRCLLGTGSISHSMMKLSNIRRQCLHSFAALGALGSKSSLSDSGDIHDDLFVES